MGKEDAGEEACVGLTKVYLPKVLNGVIVLENEEGNRWRSTNRFLKTDKVGLAFRFEKLIAAYMHQTLIWDSVIEGIDEGDGWVQSFIDVQEQSSDGNVPQFGSPAISTSMTDRSLQSGSRHSKPR